MMKSFLALFSFFLLAITTVDARKDPGEYWQGVMKDQPMPEAIQGLLDSKLPLSDKKTDCHTSTDATRKDHMTVVDEFEQSKQKKFGKDVEPRPNISSYNDDTKLSEKKSFVKDFEPRPNISSYHDDAELSTDKSFVKDFEPRPNISSYHDDTELSGEESFVKDFEPRPNISAYHDDIDLKEKKPLVEVA